MMATDGTNGAPTLVEGRQLVLNEPGICHAILAGEVVLSAVRGDGRSARHPIARIPADGLLFGLPPGALGEESVLATASADARIYRLPPGGWGVPAPTAAFADGLAHWLRALSEGLAPAVASRPRPHLVVGGALGPVSLPAEAVVSGTGAITWIELPPAGARLFGIEPVRSVVPLPPGAWLVLAEAGAIRAVDWHSGLARPEWPMALAAFNAAIAELLPLARGFGEVDEAHRIRQRQAEEEHDAVLATGRIAEIMGNPQAPRPEDGTSGLLDVMRLLGREISLPVRRPARARRAQLDMAPTAEEIARASGLALQPVRLAQDWWKSESPPMLAWRDGDRPIALMWRGDGWREFDRTGRQRRVTAETAVGIAAEAQAVLRPLPAPAGFFALLRTGFTGGRSDLALFLAALLAGSALGQALPIASNFVYGVLVPASMQGAVMQVGAMILLIGIAGAVIQFAGDAARQRIAARADGRLHDGLWDRVVALPLGTLRSGASADVAARAAAVITGVAGARQFLFVAAGGLGVALASLAFIAWCDLLLAGVAAGLVAVNLAAAILAGAAQGRAMREGEALRGGADSQLGEMVSAIATLRGAAAEERAALRWSESFAALRARLVAARRITNAYETWQATYPGLATAALFAAIFAGSVTPEGTPKLPLASVVAILTSFALMMAATSQVLRGGLMVWLLRANWAYARPLLDAAPEPAAGLTDPGALAGAIEFSALGFGYRDGPAILSDVCLRVEPGEMVAIVGPSGSGKSTLVRLLLGLERPSRGAVYVDGHDTRSLHPEALRRQIAVVLQDASLPPGTIFEIVRGLTEATPDEVWQALASAAIAEDVAAMPMGLHTLLLDAKRSLSGGQVQRLSLARAIIGRPAILVLDEATSALDNTTQALVMETVRTMPATRIVIAHRLSTLRHASRVFALEHGRLVERRDLAGGAASGDASPGGP
ncbi:MAG: NHLP bacteriocin export ABC transporter permease/ATPase subunit [Thalassobaculales bacterium]